MNRIPLIGITAIGLVLLADASLRADQNVTNNGVAWTYTYEGNFLPTNAASNPGWGTPFSASILATELVSSSILTLTTLVNSDNIAFRQTGGTGNPWNPTANGTTVEVRLKVDSLALGSGWSQELSMRMGSRLYGLAFHPGFVRSPDTGEQFNMDTTNGFHVYRFTIQSTNGLGALYIDDSATPAFTSAGSADTANVLDFGDLGNNDGGQVEWDYVRWTNLGAFTTIPEASTACLALIGLIGLGGWFRRK